MQDYNDCISSIKRNIICHLSQFGFALHCDYSLCNRINGIFPEGLPVNTECLNNLSNGNRVLINIHTPNLEYCVKYMIEVLKEKQIKLFFYVFGEPVIPEWLVNTILPYTIQMFLCNNTYDHPLIHNLPIGIRDGEEVFPEHEYYSAKILFDEGEQTREKKYLCFMCFTNTHLERDSCECVLGDKPFVVNLLKNEYPLQPSIHCGKVPVWINYQHTHESWYTLSPSGLGEATHRFFEAIYLDSIPIVKRTNTAFDKLYDVFPCLVVEDWDQVTENFLLENLDDNKEKMRLFKESYPDIFVNLDGIEELLLRT